MQAASSSSSSLSSPPGISLEGVNDVEDFPWENRPEFLMSWERYSQMYNLMQSGNQFFRGNQFEKAIDCYTIANNIKPNDHVILGNRCAAYLRISEFYLSRPPSASEYRPLNGIDPTTNAGLALKDAEKVLELTSSSVTSYILKANALILLEKYELALHVISSGLDVDPLSNALLNLQKALNDTIGMSCQGKPQLSDDFKCTVCLGLLYQPVTTPCGHSFCRSCLFQSMDQGNRCPLCRTVVFISARTCAISVTLNNIIQKMFPEQYAERKLEHDLLTNPSADFLPLFVMDVFIPCQRFHLNIFEPRYRLMVRRIMQGNRRMGMVGIDSTTGSVAEYACEVESTNCEPRQDGTFFLEVESRRRCQIIQNQEQDGYRVAKVEWIRDIFPPDGSQELHRLQEMTNKAAAFARLWVRAAQEAARDGLRREELFKAESLMPSTQDPERFSFWLASLTNQTPSERLDLLRVRDTKERIRRAFICMTAQEQHR